MIERKKITLELSKEEAQFLHDFLGNVVTGHPTMTSRRYSDSVINKLEDKGIHYKYGEYFARLVKQVQYIEFIA